MTSLVRSFFGFEILVLNFFEFFLLGAMLLLLLPSSSTSSCLAFFFLLLQNLPLGCDHCLGVAQAKNNTERFDYSFFRLLLLIVFLSNAI